MALVQKSIKDLPLNQRDASASIIEQNIAILFYTTIHPRKIYSTFMLKKYILIQKLYLNTKIALNTEIASNTEITFEFRDYIQIQEFHLNTDITVKCTN